ncbi:MAG: hypothetical protein KIT22_04035 [Verrucomicrobiae bacterium]|nr:hypothetical protein [Verrucomicrobiae bacterium]
MNTATDSRSPMPSLHSMPPSSVMPLPGRRSGAGAFLVAILLAMFSGGILQEKVQAQYAWFGRPNDSIKISGQTVVTRTATYEARFLIPEGVNFGGYIYLETNADNENKQLRVSSRRIYGYNREGVGNTPAKGILSYDAFISRGEWHHIAFVSDQNEDRLYLDGDLVAAVPRSFNIGNSAAGGFIGAALVAGEVRNGFRGYLDFVRLSRIPRYSGLKFAAPTQVSSDAETLLLYNFDDPVGSGTARDESPLQRHGELGVSFEGSTSPSFTSTAGPAQGGLGVDVSLNPRATYLLNQNDAPFNSIPIDLEKLGFVPGDRIRLQRIGDFISDIQRPNFIAAQPFSLTAVFSQTNILDLGGELHRVIGAIDAGLDVTTVPADGAPLSNDIPEDFRVDGTGLLELQIPEGARFLYACPLDLEGGRRFVDNLDINGDFGIHIEKVSTLGLSIEPAEGAVILRWDNGNLQSRPSLQTGGTWTDLLEAISPYRVDAGKGKEFFRLLP